MGKSRIVVVSSGTVFTSSGDVHGPTLRRMLERGFSRLADVADPAEAIRAFFRPEDRIGIKINTIGGRRISTRPDLALPFAAWISEKVIPSANVLVWDRTNRELKEAGFKLSAGTGRPRVFGTDTDGLGYAAALVAHRSIGSLFSTIQQDFATASVSLAILKDHGLAGVTAGMKNYFGAVHNPNKYHDGGCDPYVAEIFDSPPVRGKHRLSILDCLTVQYHKGPSFTPNGPRGTAPWSSARIPWPRTRRAGGSSKACGRKRDSPPWPRKKGNRIILRPRNAWGWEKRIRTTSTLSRSESEMDRRRFIRNCAGGGIVLGTSLPSICLDLAAFGEEPNLSRFEARYYRKLPDRETECLLCPRLCKLGDKERGYCGVRENQGGTYYSLVYGKACTLNADPVEKKPFFHFLPGTNALSLATAGCNVNCRFCQNWQISQVRPEQVKHFDLPPGTIAGLAGRYRCPSVAFTYTEPVVFFEYMQDAARENRNQHVRSLVVTGGHIMPEPLADLLKVVDAIKIDLKAFSEKFYDEYVRGKLEHGSRIDPDRGKERGLARSRLPCHSDPQRRSRGDPGDEPMAARGGGPGRSSPFFPFPADVSDEKPPSDSPGDAGKGQGDRPGRGAPLRLYRKRPGTRSRKYLLSLLPQGSHRQERIRDPDQRNPQGEMRPLRRSHSGDMGLTANLPALVMGFLAAAFQIFLLREFSVHFFGNELTFGFVLASWLLWSGLGSLTAPRFRAPRETLDRFYYIAILLFVGSLVILRFSRFPLGIRPGEITGPAPALCLPWGSAFSPPSPWGFSSFSTPGEPEATSRESIFSNRWEPRSAPW